MRKIKKTTYIEGQEPVEEQVWSEQCIICGKLIQSPSIKRVNYMMKMHQETNKSCLSIRKQRGQEE